MKTKSLILALAIGAAGVGVASAGDCYYGKQRYVPRQPAISVNFGFTSRNRGYNNCAPQYYAPRYYQPRRVVVQQPRHYCNDRRVVYAVQQRLIRAGYYRGNCDGLWGPATRRAVINCQRDYGLPVTGLIDQVFLGRLF